MDVSHPQGKYGFGLDRDKVVAELRGIADRIERGDVIPQEFSWNLCSIHNNYRQDIIKLTLVSPVEK